MLAQPARVIVAAHQPHYFPWIGLVHKIAQSDVFIHLDDVQFEKRGFQNRTRYSTDAGLKFLSIPVFQKGLYADAREIRDMRISEPAKLIKHWRALQHRYTKSPGWPQVAERLEALLTSPPDRMIDLCLATTHLTLEVFEVDDVRFQMSSDHDLMTMKAERIVDLTEKGGGTAYLSGTGAQDYLEESTFTDRGLRLHFQQFEHPEYLQRTKHPFEKAAFALEWFLEAPEEAVSGFHTLVEHNRP
jgi:hypothetical protein